VAERAASEDLVTRVDAGEAKAGKSTKKASVKKAAAKTAVKTRAKA
jgi:hypothetical protein